MQKSGLNNNAKSGILLVSSICIAALSIPFVLQHIMLGHGVYVGIHIVSTVLGSFLSVVSFLTYSEFRTKRLLLVTFAFFAISTAEAVSLINYVLPFTALSTGFDAIITHGLILLMLSFFAIGVFRSD